MSAHVRPLEARRFRKAVLDYLSPAKRIKLYDLLVKDHLEKLELIDAGYGRWLKRLLPYLVNRYGLQGKRVLDLGCGTGELTVRMNLLGFETMGIDVHGRALDLAKILAVENGLPETTFVENNAERLAFAENSFDIVTMFSVLEHLNDQMLINSLLPELKRICRGLVYVLVPNRLKVSDDHTGLRFVCWMPKRLAEMYIKVRGPKYRYLISASGSWDVSYRTFGRISSLFQRDFLLDFPSEEVIYPPLDKTPMITRIGKNVRIGDRKIFIGVPIPWKLMVKMGYPKEGFYPYLNLVAIPRKSRTTHSP
jgi:2-polyprenyl-3-methyl-5-hydroxy-6-metoxy-1,4-benzoquinol methylase